MAGRNRLPYPDNFRGIHQAPHPIMHRRPLPPHPIAVEEELELQQRDIQTLVAENRLVIDDNVMLQRDLTAVKDEIHRLSQVIPKLNAEREAHQRELIERGMKLEAELRASEPLRAEVVQLRSETQKLSSLRKELSSQVQNLKKDVSQLKSDNKQITVMKSDVEKMQKEMIEARRIYEFEKKENEELLEQNQSMEKNLIAMAREIEILHAEQANSDRRTVGVAGYGIPEARYPGRPYGDSYGAVSWGLDKHGLSRR